MHKGVCLSEARAKKKKEEKDIKNEEYNKE